MTQQKPQQRSRKKLTIISVIILVAMLGLAFMWLRPNGTVQASDKEEVKQEVNQALQTDFKGQLLHESLTDVGCQQTDIAWSGNGVYCNIEGRKYYQSQDTPQSTLNKLQESFTQRGWYSDEANTMRFYKSAKDPVVFIADLSMESLRNEELAKSLPQKVKEKLGLGQRVYEVLVTDTYWSCVTEHLLSQPCPVPPGELK